MPTVTENVDLPLGVDPTRAVVTFELIGGGGSPLKEAYNTATGKTVAGQRAVHLDGTTAGSPAVGSWSLTTLDPNSDLLPAGTVWGRSLTGPAIRANTTYALVPATGGPYRWDQILAEAPGTLASAALTSHAIDTDLHGGGRLLAIVSKTDGSFATSAFGVPITGMDMPVTVPAKSDGTIRPYVVRFFADVIVSGPSPALMFASIMPRVGGFQIGTEWRTEGHSSTDGAAQRLTAFFEVDVPNAIHNPAPGSIVTYQPYAAVFPGTATLTVLAQQAFGIPVPATFKAVTQ